MLSVIQSLPPVILAAALLLCPEPEAAETEAAAQPKATPNAGPALVETVANDGAGEVPIHRVVASSPLPAGFHAGGRFGYRASRRTGERTFHAGLDFTAPRGTPVYAVARGIVETVAHDSARSAFNGYGNAVVLRHEDGYWSFYAHLDEALVTEGQEVEPGELIGRVGNSTNRRFPGMGTHLHFEVRVARPDGSSPFPGVYRRHNVDPERWLAAMGVRFEPSPEDGCIARGDVDDELAQAAPVLVVREVERESVHIASL